VDEISLVLGLAVVATPVGISGLGYAVKNSRRNGKMNQSLNDLKDQYEKHVQDDLEFQKIVGKSIEAIDEKLGQITVSAATSQNDIAWIKEAIKNGKAPKR
jgi:hypothetical protein